MRRAAWVVLLLFIFTIPWEYSLDLGVPLGNVARILGLAALVLAILAVLQAGGIRPPGSLQWLVLGLYLWFCCTLFWSIDPAITLEKLRGYFQEMMVVSLVSEFVETKEDLRAVLRCWLGGSWLLAVLTLASLWSRVDGIDRQIRFVAAGQDPNDVARFLALGLPVAGLLLWWERTKRGKAFAGGYIVTGCVAVLATASRGGFIAAMVGLAICLFLIFRKNRQQQIALILVLPLACVAAWIVLPVETVSRIVSILDQLQGGDLNQRTTIWGWGWNAFVRNPFLGHGAGTFVDAAGLAPIDTAHNTALSILVEGGIVGLILAVAIVVESVRSSFRSHGAMRIAFLGMLTVWSVSSTVGSVFESRTTWLMFAVIAASEGVHGDRRQESQRAFASQGDSECEKQVA